MRITSVTMGCICLLLADFASAQRKGLSVEEKVRIVDKLCLTLSNDLCPEETRLKFVKGETTITEVANSYRDDPRLLKQLAHFWVPHLKIVGAVDWDATINRLTGENLGAQLVAGRARRDSANKAMVYDAGRKAYALVMSTNITLANNAQGRSERAFYQKNGCHRTPRNLRDAAAISGLSAAQRALLASEGLLANGTWRRGSLVKVNPWWDPSQTINVCEGLVAADVCGPKLSQCFPNDNTLTNSAGIPRRDPQNYYVRHLDEGITMEPGYLIAGVTVSETLGWEKIAFGNFTMASGVVQHFLSIPNWGGIIASSGPEGQWLNDEGIVSLPNADDPTDTTFYPIYHQDNLRHAGIMTTLAFQKTFNGHYAKANGAMEGLLCRKFAAPDGEIIPPSQENEPANMPFCENCHKILDPLAQHFRRWPSIGDTNFYYDPTSGISAVGQFEGVQDADTVGLGRTFSKLDDLYTCGIQRNFEFLTGRPMNDEEKASLMPKLFKSLKENKNNMWTVMIQIIESGSFLGER